MPSTPQSPHAPIDLSLNLRDTHVLITGAAGHIGTRTVHAFLAAGSRVTAVDISAPGLQRLKSTLPSPSPVPHSSDTHESYSARLHCVEADICNESEIARAFQESRRWAQRPVECVVALAALDLSALPHMRDGEGVAGMSAEQFRRTLDVNVTGTFLTAREWLRGIKAHILESWRGEGQGEAQGDEGQEQRMPAQQEDVVQRAEMADERPDVNAIGLGNVNLVIVGSESGSFGERGNPDYATSKSAVQGGLLRSLAADVGRVGKGIRVNAIAPGPVDTEQFRKECRENPEQLWLDAQATTALRRPVPVDSVAKGILFLASDSWSGNVHGQVLSVDSGKQGKVMWSKEECG